MNDVKHALLLIPRVKKENHLGGCRRSHRGGGVLECFVVLSTLISCPSSRLIGSIVTEISDTEKKLLFIQQFCYCDPQLIIDTWKGFHPLTGRVKMHCFCIDWSAIATAALICYMHELKSKIPNCKNSVSMKCAKWFISNIVESYPRRYSCGVLWTPSFQPSLYLVELQLSMSLLVIIFFCIWYMYTYSTQNIILQIFVGCDVVMVVKKIPINHLVEVTDCKATCPRWSQVKSPSSLISAFSPAILYLKMLNFTLSQLPLLSLSHRLFTDSEMEYFYSGCTLAVLLIIFMDSQFPVGFTCQAK